MRASTRLDTLVRAQLLKGTSTRRPNAEVGREAAEIRNGADYLGNSPKCIPSLRAVFRQEAARVSHREGIQCAGNTFAGNHRTNQSRTSIHGFVCETRAHQGTNQRYAQEVSESLSKGCMEGHSQPPGCRRRVRRSSF